MKLEECLILRLAFMSKKYYKNNMLLYKNDKSYVGFVDIIPAACFKVVFQLANVLKIEWIFN